MSLASARPLLLPPSTQLWGAGSGRLRAAHLTGAQGQPNKRLGTFMSQDRSFGDWKTEVDGILADRFLGLITDDLPDVDYWSYYQSGTTPEEAAELAYQNAMEG